MGPTANYNQDGIASGDGGTDTSLAASSGGAADMSTTICMGKR